MRISIVGIVGLPACYGGFETLVENLVSDSRDHRFTVYCSSKNYKVKPSEINGVKLKYLPFNANGSQSIIYDIVALCGTIFTRPDVVLILGVSGCTFLPVYRLFCNAKIITNIDGLEWKRNKWGRVAKAFLKFSERIAVRFSDVVIADNKAIADYVAKEYSVTPETIAYGGDHAVGSGLVPIKGLHCDYDLALCRIEPENNVEMILNAYSHSDRKIKFVGNWSNSSFGKRLKEIYGDKNNIEILDPIYDLEELFRLRSGCNLYIHGHSAGGTNPSLVEMMHFGKSIICYNCNYNIASTEGQASYFDDKDELLRLISTDVNNGDAMLSIASRKYTWDFIRKEYYRSFVG